MPDLFSILEFLVNLKKQAQAEDLQRTDLFTKMAERSGGNMAQTAEQYPTLGAAATRTLGLPKSQVMGDYPTTPYSPDFPSGFDPAKPMMTQQQPNALMSMVGAKPKEVPLTRTVWPNLGPTPEQATAAGHLDVSRGQLALGQEQLTTAKEQFAKTFKASEEERKAVQERHVDTVRKEWANALGLHGVTTDELGKERKLNFKEVYQYANSGVRTGELPENVRWTDPAQIPNSVSEWKAAVNDAKTRLENNPKSTIDKQFANMSYPDFLKFDANTKMQGLTSKDAFGAAFKIEDDARQAANTILAGQGLGDLVIGPGGVTTFQLKNPERDTAYYLKTMDQQYNIRAKHYSDNFGVKIPQKGTATPAPKAEPELATGHKPKAEEKKKTTITYSVAGKGNIEVLPQEVSDFIKKYPNAMRID